MKRTALTLLSMGLLTGCGYVEAPPPQAPAKVVPSNVEPRTTPPEPGLTRVILDANGDKAMVVEILDATSTIGTAHAGGTVATVHGYSETAKPVCVAPCIADFKPGAHVLRFTSQSDERSSSVAIQVGDRTKVIRHAMGRTESSSAGSILLGMTGMLLTTAGAIALATGGTLLAVNGGRDDHGGSTSMVRDTSLGMTLGGAGALAIGIPLLLLSRPVRQPGATTEVAVP